MGELSAKRGTRRYLEIGVQTGKLMAHISAECAVGVDPDYNIKHNIAVNKKEVTLHQCTSDKYFDAHLGDENFDLIFIDGMHTFEYALRDFYNAERLSHGGTLIVLHDCLPVDGPMIERVEEVAVEKCRNPLYDSFWTGDVWKLISILRDTRPDLQVVGVDCPPTGLLCVTKVDPSSRVLRHNYLEIVRKYAAIPNTWESVLKAYKGLTTLSSAAVTNEFDHSLYFQV